MISSLVVAGLGVSLMRDDLAIAAQRAGEVVLWGDKRLLTTLSFVHLAEREDEPVVYGLTKNLDSFNPGRVAAHEHFEMLRDVAQSASWRDRLSYVVRGPGWAYRQQAARA